MSVSTEQRRPAAATRRAGYTVSVLVNAALLIAINVWPGWPAVPFLTDATQEVVGFVNASIAVGLAANAVYLLARSEVAPRAGRHAHHRGGSRRTRAAVAGVPVRLPRRRVRLGAGWPGSCWWWRSSAV